MTRRLHPTGHGPVSRWTWGLVVVTALALVATAVVAEPPDDDPPAETSGDGGRDDLLASLLGDDPRQLAACLAPDHQSSEELPDEPDAAIDVIADQVAAERDLAFTDPVAPELLAPAELRDRVVAMTREEAGATVDADARLLTALGVLDPDVDLQQLTLDLLGEQVAGFYDPESGELTALASDGLDPMARVTLAHELDHALVDQAIGLPDLEGETGGGDARLASLAVVEGDATVLMQRWAATHLGLLQQLGLASGAGVATTALERAPWLLQQQLVFPYTAGLTFVCRQLATGGWPAVDALYADLPTTTAQVLWPDRYARGEVAVDVDAPPPPADDWERLRTDQLGAADLLWLFQAPGDDRGAALADAEQRARAWAGGRMLVAGRHGATAVGIVLAEHAEAPRSLCSSVRTWYDRSFDDDTMAEDGATTTWTGTEQSARLRCGQGRVRLGIAPDPATAGAMTD